MIIPEFWAEARRRHRGPKKQVTVKRFGWSNTSLDDAQAMADRRAEGALSRIISGEELVRRETKVPYAGDDGLPIREEILARHGEDVITRNAYGAHCLNTPRALFADVDFAGGASGRQLASVFAALAVVAMAVGSQLGTWRLILGLVIAAALMTMPLAHRLAGLLFALQGGREQVSRKQVRAFVARHPDWNVRLYRTPAGLRLLATHQPFEPSDPLVADFFQAVSADPVYVRMCNRQDCFRARLTAKPWRIGLKRMRPVPGVWPVAPERMPIRSAWVVEYEAKAANYAACAYLESVGSGSIHSDVRPTVDLHDRESRALVPEVAIA